ncbi:hypothetical protein HNP46_006115 [Pseudomonas nitritireducens]|uniref:Uncharacterized protein n=1 Tax=Pseudomonas nitroreducens TaxID=46680 RepID=A0A7W7KRF7_PSENT|nr:hypothetical protein [Pseudomonas nitritireducens]MBB4867204.1 hypothetical protein [Pseudomonas nitritireducens]
MGATLDQFAMLRLGDFKSHVTKILKDFQYVYLLQKDADGTLMQIIDVRANGLVDDKNRLSIKVGDNFEARVMASLDGGKFRLKSHSVKINVDSLENVSVDKDMMSHSIIMREDDQIVMLSGSHEKIEGSLSKALEAIVKPYAKWSHDGVLKFKSTEA